MCVCVYVRACVRTHVRVCVVCTFLRFRFACVNYNTLPLMTVEMVCMLHYQGTCIWLLACTVCCIVHNVFVV